MARPIASTPPLEGEAAKRFVEAMQNPKQPTPVRAPSQRELDIMIRKAFAEKPE